MSHGPLPVLSVIDDVVVGFEPSQNTQPPSGRMNWFHRHSISVFTILCLIVAASAVEVGSIYWNNRISIAESTQSSIKVLTRPAQGPNIVVARTDLSKSVHAITSQSISLTIANKTVPVDSQVIKSWLQIVSDRAKGVSYIHANQSLISKSLNEVTASYIQAPVNQVSVSHGDGSSFVISKGVNGVKLADTNGVAKQISQSLLSARGMQLTLPTESQAYGTQTADDFDKLIEVDVVTKQMYLYNRGKLYKSYPISAGAPITPTPIGQYKIFEKLAIQDMRGFNANGTRYLQPNVRWINYFKQGGYAIHGNYWRPTSWFGAINSSHGCVSLPESQAKDVYDWAPIGTTVITHY